MFRILLPIMLVLGLACGQVQPRPEGPELEPVHSDKRALLTTISRLGASQSQDIDLMRKVTRVTFAPKEIPDAFWRNCEFVGYFPQAPTLINGQYCYRIDENGRYQSAVRLTFNQKALCITIEDLESILGKPTRYHTVAEAIHPGHSGPGYITGVTYQYPTSPRTHFSISTTTYCVSDVSISSYQKA